MTEEIIAIVSIALIILIAAIYIIKAKKSGAKCIGCPHAKTCQSAKACQSSKTKGGEKVCGCGCGGVAQSEDEQT